MHSTSFEARRVASGFGLIEVLIALVVLSVGALAMIGMQLTGKQANFDAVQRTAASHLAADMIERIRADPLGSGAYLTGAVIGGGSLAAPAPACTSAAPCAPTELAAADLYDWERLMDGQAETRGGVSTGGLVQPRACITGPFGGGTGLYQLTLIWRGSQTLEPVALGAGVCGGGLDGLAFYGDDAAPTSDQYRRVITITFFLTV